MMTSYILTVITALALASLSALAVNPPQGLTQYNGTVNGTVHYVSGPNRTSNVDYYFFTSTGPTESTSNITNYNFGTGSQYIQVVLYYDTQGKLHGTGWAQTSYGSPWLSTLDVTFSFVQTNTGTPVAYSGTWDTVTGLFGSDGIFYNVTSQSEGISNGAASAYDGNLDGVPEFFTFSHNLSGYLNMPQE